jgi:hypothetical protein
LILPNTHLQEAIFHEVLKKKETIWNSPPFIVTLVARFFFLYVSFLPILQCSYIGHHPQKELTKFGYRSDRKVERFKNPVIYFGNLLSKYGYFKKKKIPHVPRNVSL